MVSWKLLESNAKAILTLLLGEALMKKFPGDHTVKTEVIPRQVLMLALHTLDGIRRKLLQDEKRQAEAAKAYAAIRAAQKMKLAEATLAKLVEVSKSDE